MQRNLNPLPIISSIWKTSWGSFFTALSFNEASGEWGIDVDTFFLSIPDEFGSVETFLCGWVGVEFTKRFSLLIDFEVFESRKRIKSLFEKIVKVGTMMTGLTELVKRWHQIENNNNNQIHSQLSLSSLQTTKFIYILIYDKINTMDRNVKVFMRGDIDLFSSNVWDTSWHLHDPNASLISLHQIQNCSLPLHSPHVLQESIEFTLSEEVLNRWNNHKQVPWQLRLKHKHMLKETESNRL